MDVVFIPPPPSPSPPFPVFPLYCSFIQPAINWGSFRKITFQVCMQQEYCCPVIQICTDTVHITYILHCTCTNISRAGNSLIRSSLILLISNERLWAICSDRSREMSNCERIAQTAHIKRATMSDSLRLLITKEQLWAIRSGRSPKMSKWEIRSTIFG